MFPWLKPENENYGQNLKQKAEYRQNDGLGNYARYANRQNQSEQDLLRAQKNQLARQESTEERRNDEKEVNAYNHSRSENKLNQEKYNPFYDNQLSHNLKLNSRSGRTRFDGRNSQTPKSPKENVLAFDQDYKHQVIEKNKQDYKNYYRDNVSEFQKKQQGASIKSLEDKKSILQFQYGKDNTGLHQRMSENARTSVSPQQKQKDYAETLKKQIEEKKEYEKNRQRKENELDFQNNNFYYGDYQQRQSPNKFQQQQQLAQNYQNQAIESKKQQNRKNVGFEDQKNDNYDKQNYKSEVDYEALARANNYRESYNSPQETSKARRQSNGDNQIYRNEQYEEQPQNMQENRRQSKQKANFENDQRINNKRKWDDEEQKNIIGQIYDNESREQQLKKQREYQYYKQLEEEIALKKGRRVSNQASRNQNEKSMLDQLGENYNRQLELQQLHKAEVANELQQQIKEKKRLQRIEKEKQDLLDRQYEEKVKAQLNELKAKYEIEKEGKQHEIKSLRKNLEKKKQEQLQKQGEMVLSKSKSPPKNKVENSPRVQNKYDESFSHNQYSDKNLDNYPLERNSVQQEEDNMQYGRNKFNDITEEHEKKKAHDIHQQARDIRQQKRHEDREKLRDSLFDKQSQYYQSMEVNKEWNPPQFWQYKERKNMEELTKLKEQLDMQTSLLQNEVTKIKQDAQIASEMKSQAFIDLENLKDSLKRQNMIENIKLKELKQNLGSLGYVQNEFLPSSSQLQGQYASGNQNYAANNIFQNQQQLNQGSTRNINYNQLNQSAFSQNFNNSQLGLSNLYGNNSFNNNLSTNKYGLQQTDILDKLVSSNVNVYKFEGSKINNKPTTLDFKLEKRLNNVNLNKAEIQLLEVDNLLNNLRNGL
ncbi:hypothetical protein TTHERM_00571770 (macronuclear) [Tetrahymena thermophila SB210]|uniref:Uncharacterized protein n=1 Tax=Tetrahymena thermophila (strain SB210) TaxID=312017 RepID=Q24HZ7_TETTS|nr:hypothetical protein TTHERM_00571770 [Tetrahymena thermophila SB210]EAS07441.1 hypothetical protein TTHERM_00571770 [Tetrahymena thermophila SB210]|eukprot:XP_001027683.1 hypothetical protein TTHERM_00571770 [Tetrahymena thermophila SB210]